MFRTRLSDYPWTRRSGIPGIPKALRKRFLGAELASEARSFRSSPPWDSAAAGLRIRGTGGNQGRKDTLLIAFTRVAEGRQRVFFFSLLERAR